MHYLMALGAGAMVAQLQTGWAIVAQCSVCFPPTHPNELTMFSDVQGRRAADTAMGQTPFPM